ncbi:adhesion G protein-coupled receptor L2-like [Ruditapes philippinarum]|uniref:adhesion G protein-coupled receptor L2-like n=1 Tax=Ruditapes philippinarum TaxID=129788 RepID=UPI00295B094D|nr:adhesion G protein-coupled receptor L2-like [Ruditapes philippinarum]
MFKLTLASFVNTALLHTIFFKFGSLTLATENPTNNGCTPDFIKLTISDDLPKNDRSTKVQFFCNNWNSISVYFRLKNTYDEHRFFSIEHASTGNLNYLILTITNVLYINTWNTDVIVLKEPYRNETLNIVPIKIDVKEANDRPTILPQNLLTEVREDVPVGTLVGNFLISDPDDGKFGDLQVGMNTREDIDINEWFEVVKLSNDTIQIRTASVLDADEYWNSQNVIHNERRGPTFTFEVEVRDGGGLKDHSIIEITIIDIGDLKPVCNHQTLTNQTHWTKRGAIVTNLDNFCRARNYMSAVVFFQEVTYSLISDSCKFSDCFKTSSNRYKGFKTTTFNGHTCQRWDSQTPHKHSLNQTDRFPDISVFDAANYCRDPDGEGLPWCYTKNASVRWQFCGIYKCPGVSDCLKTSISSNRYNGFKTTTFDGHTCQRWDSQTPHKHSRNKAHKFPDISVSDAANYCRDPDGEGLPWCYTTDPKLRWQFCGIYKCQGVFDITNNGMVKLQNEVPSDIMNCTLSVRASDKAFPTINATFSLLIEFTKCLSDTDYQNIQWESGTLEQTTWRECPAGYIGQVSRYCTERGYQDPVYNCTKSSIDNIYKKLIEDMKTGQVDIVEVLDELSIATSATYENNTLFIGDIVTAFNILTKIIDVVTVNTTNLENITNAYVQTINNILDESTIQTWKVNINQTGSGADVVLKITDSFVEKILTTSKNITAEISKSNLYLKMGSVQSCSEALSFPEREKGSFLEWARPRKDKLMIDCDSTVESFSGIMYRNLSMIIPSFTSSTKSEDLRVNAPVISFTFYPIIKRQLVNPVEITFQLFNHSLDNARCSFWKDSKSETSQGYWSDEGCRQKIVNKDKDVVVCVCNHLTNFALLMSPSSTKIDEDQSNALSIISMIGCIVSIICVVLCLAIHAFFWRFVKSVRSIIHMNLSCWLVVAYILFLAGINRTENKDVCTLIAVLLHLVFLIIFFGMLTEGCNLSYTVLKPLSSRKPGIPLMIASYVIAVIIVVVSMGVSQLHGYGTEQTCWLSTETGLIWAFLAPVLVVILVNFIIVVLVIRTMCGTTAMSKKSTKGRAKAALRCILILMPLMGLTWGFGALSLNSDTIVFQFIFAILNSFQGLLIFIFHCVMDKKIKDALSKQRYKWLQSLQSFGVPEGKRNKTEDTSDF